MGGWVKFESFMHSGKSSVEEEINLVDRMGQKLVVHIQNKLSAGGQRHLTIYCPYWVLNLTQYRLWFRQEGRNALPAGSEPIPEEVSVITNTLPGYLVDGGGRKFSL